MSPKAPIRVAIVDDEPGVRTALARLLDASSFETTTYGSARDFIDSIRRDVPECLIVATETQKAVRILFQLFKINPLPPTAALFRTHR